MFVLAYCRRLFRRAWTDSWRTIKANAVWDGAIVLAALLIAFILGKPDAWTVALYALAALGTASLLVYFFQLVTAPARIDREQQSRIAELESATRLNEKKPGPYVLLGYESQNQKPIDPVNYLDWEQWKESGGGSTEESKKPFILENINDMPALRVQVQPFFVGDCLVEFPEVPRLLKEGSLSVYAVIKDAGSRLGQQFGCLLETAWEQADHKPITVPIVVSYKDTEGNKWETEHVLTYEYYRYQVTPKERRLVKG